MHIITIRHGRQKLSCRDLKRSERAWRIARVYIRENARALVPRNFSSSIYPARFSAPRLAASAELLISCGTSTRRRQPAATNLDKTQRVRGDLSSKRAERGENREDPGIALKYVCFYLAYARGYLQILQRYRVYVCARYRRFRPGLEN